jgi:16S rRNA (adenine1518-N6/adenine1519-N6)-dimethyltransferase
MQHLAPKKSLGQNFLIDRNIAEKIVREFDPRAGETVVEIGPGEGALTGLLAARESALMAVELDPRMVERIRETYGTRIEVLEKDFLETDIGEIARMAGVGSVRVIGNIPYYITSPILFHLFDGRGFISDAMVMMQREVAERLVARPRSKEYGILSVMTQTYTIPKLLFNVGPRCFFPPPKVTSAVVSLRFRDIEGIAGLEEDHRSIVRAAFNQRRKTLRNALSQLVPDNEPRERLFEHAGISGGRRAEELDTAEFITLARAWRDTRAETLA